MYAAPVSNTDEPSGQRAYQATKDRILSGTFRGGQLLSEVEVASDLGVSRTPVHEAFLRLAAEDLLELLPRRGAVVVPVAPSDAADLLEMRLALETASVRRLCRSPELLGGLVADLTELVDEQRRRAAAGDTLHFAAADDAFHRCIVESAGNTIARRFYCSLSDRQRRMMVDVAQADSARLAYLIDDHERLANTIGDADAEAFESALVAHLESSYRVGLR
jgi:DNA-binding GntR family transcriptional regulator